MIGHIIDCIALKLNLPQYWPETLLDRRLLLGSK